MAQRPGAGRPSPDRLGGNVAVHFSRYYVCESLQFVIEELTGILLSLDLSVSVRYGSVSLGVRCLQRLLKSIDL